jgi:hypothetical protein
MNHFQFEEISTIQDFITCIQAKKANNCTSLGKPLLLFASENNVMSIVLNVYGVNNFQTKKFQAIDTHDYVMGLETRDLDVLAIMNIDRYYIYYNYEHIYPNVDIDGIKPPATDFDAEYYDEKHDERIGALTQLLITNCTMELFEFAMTYSNLNGLQLPYILEQAAYIGRKDILDKYLPLCHCEDIE